MRQVTKQREEKANREVKFWLTVVLLPTGAIVVVQILWVVIARAAGIRAVPPSDSGAVLAIVGGVLGSVFTIGGLVIALGSLLSLMTIENRARQVMEDKFRELQPEFMSAVDARILSLRATIAAEKRQWREAEALTKKALLLSPDLPGARAALGLAMADDICIEYAVEQGLDTAHHDAVYRRLRAGVRAAALIPEAIKWLEDAVEHGEEDRRAWLILAQLYGIHRRRDRMLEAVEQAVDRFADARETLLTAVSLSMLVNACEGDERAIQRLAKMLGAQLILSEETISRTIAQADATGHLKTTWLVAPRKPSSPAAVSQSRPSALALATDGKGYFVEYQARENGEGDDGDVDSPEIVLIPIADYVRMLCSEHIFVRQLLSTPDPVQ